jgi:hypothetical protein
LKTHRSPSPSSALARWARDAHPRDLPSRQ